MLGDKTVLVSDHSLYIMFTNNSEFAITGLPGEMLRKTKKY